MCSLDDLSTFNLRAMKWSKWDPEADKSLRFNQEMTHYGNFRKQKAKDVDSWLEIYIGV